MSIRAGFAKEPVPNPIGQELSGYGYFLERKCTGITDQLFVRCVVIEHEGSKSVIMSADLIGLRQDVVDKTRSMITERLGIPDEAVMLVCTHTHTGPATHQLYGCGVVDDDYLKQWPSFLCGVAEKACSDLSEVDGISEVCEPIEAIGYNRVLKDSKPHDAFVRGVCLSVSGRRDIALVSYPCHAVTLGKLKTTSADYPGALCALFDQQSVDAIFLNGCCGDIDPVSNRVKWGSGTKETIDGYAKLIRDGFFKGLTPAGDAKVSSFGLDAVVPLMPMNEDVIAIGLEKAANKEVARNWADIMKNRLSDPDEEKIRVYGVRIGNTVFCAIPYEGYTCIGDEARKSAGGYNLAVLGCGDSTKSYLPDIAPGQEYCYAALDAAMLYEHRMYRADAAVSLGRQIGEGLKKRL